MNESGRVEREVSKKSHLFFRVFVPSCFLDSIKNNGSLKSFMGRMGPIGLIMSTTWVIISELACVIANAVRKKLNRFMG